MTPQSEDFEGTLTGVRAGRIHVVGTIHWSVRGGGQRIAKGRLTPNPPADLLPFVNEQECTLTTGKWTRRISIEDTEGNFIS